MALWRNLLAFSRLFFAKLRRVLSPRPHSPRRRRSVIETNSTSADHSSPINMLFCFESAMLLEDEEPLGPLLGKFPPELLRLVLAHLTPFERALFARAPRCSPCQRSPPAPPPTPCVARPPSGRHSHTTSMLIALFLAKPKEFCSWFCAFVVTQVETHLAPG